MYPRKLFCNNSLRNYFIIEEFSVLNNKSFCEPLLHLFTSDRNLEVLKYDDPKETKSSDKKWNGYKVVLHYNLIISCNKKELCNELNASWAKISKLWMREHEKAGKNDKEPNLLNVFWGFL